MKKNTAKKFGQKWKKNELKKEEGTIMTIKQCTCGRSASYPYCDGTHKIKKEPELVELSKDTKDML
jgi:CDGSH-type Zn-finger protein